VALVLRMGTRASPLARAQAELMRAALEARHPGLQIETILVRTTGDQLRHGPLPGGKGLFIREIEEGIAAGRLDFGIHSMKDVPARLASGLVIGAVPARADARDVLIGAPTLGALAHGARVGTASVRRRAQLLARRPDVQIVFLRGNVDTRLRKWRAGVADALVLAAAGLARLGLDEPDAHPIDPEECLPAVGQGALALECRADDDRTRALLAAIEDAPAAIAVAAERAFLEAIGGDCNTPLAAHATVSDDTVHLRAMVSDSEGRRRLDDAGTAAAQDADALGRQLAERLIGRGAAEILGQ
jgi:hydroxymethylbilane synthase